MAQYKLILVLVFLAMNHVPFVHAENLHAKLSTTPLHESYQDEAPVSGSVIAGIILSGYGNNNKMLLYPPEFALGQQVCVQVMSRDGRYWSKNSFKIPNKISSKAIELEYPSKYLDFLVNLKPEDLAILSMPGDCEQKQQATFIASQAFSESKGKAVIQIYVNSGRADTYITVMNDKSKKRPVMCKVIQEGRRTGYDTICTLNYSELNVTGTELQIKIVRRVYERMLPATEFILAVPSLD